MLEPALEKYAEFVASNDSIISINYSVPPYGFPAP
jgi:hypothetical protein